MHALRAHKWTLPAQPWLGFQSLIWVACPTGGVGEYRQSSRRAKFQSLIWVACPTGVRQWGGNGFPNEVSIPHMGCMPYGRRSMPRHAAIDPEFQSLIWVACPTGIYRSREQDIYKSFNPSYGLHALRAAAGNLPVSRGCRRFNPSYGLHALRAYRAPTCGAPLSMFQSLIWVACPTGTCRQHLQSS